MIAYYKIEIAKSTDRSWCWYNNKIGQTFDVAKPKMFCGKMVYQIASGKYTHKIVRVEDTEILIDYNVEILKRECNNVGCAFNNENICTNNTLFESNAITCFGKM